MKNKNHEMTAVLSYLGILVLIPFLVVEKKKRDDFIKFHLRQGFILLFIEIILSVLMSIFSWIPFLGTVISSLLSLVWLALLIVIIIAIIKALNGEKWKIPIVCDYTNLIKI